MDLQALRYASMVSTMTFEQAEETYKKYLENLGRSDAEQSLLDFLGWAEPGEGLFAQDVRIILASADFSKELTTTVLWLNGRGLDIRCVRLQPYSDREGRILLDVQQVIPLPETEEFQIQVREKAQQEKTAKRQRGENKKLRVEFSDDGTIFNETTATETFIKSLKKMGLERIFDLESDKPLVGSRRLVSKEAPGVRHREEGEYFITTHSNTDLKAHYLKLIAKELDINITVE